MFLYCHSVQIRQPPTMTSHIHASCCFLCAPTRSWRPHCLSGSQQKHSIVQGNVTGACRLLAPLLPLIFSPLTTIRRGMASLLTHLIFASAHTAQQASGGSHTDKDSGALTLLLPRCFLHHFSFPCKTVPTQLRACAVGDKDASHCAQVLLTGC